MSGGEPDGGEVGEEKVPGNGTEPDRDAGTRKHRLLKGLPYGCKGVGRTPAGIGDRQGSWFERSWKCLPLACYYPELPRLQCL